MVDFIFAKLFIVFSFEITTGFKVLENNFTKNIFTATFKGIFIVSWLPLIMSKKRFKRHLYSRLI